MAVIHVKTVPGAIPIGYDEAIEGHKESSVGTGDQHFSVTLSKGGSQAIREVFIYIPIPGPGAKFDVARGTTSTHVDLVKNVYWNASTFVTLDEAIESTLGLVIMVNHDGTAQDVYVVVKYYYK